MLKLGGRFSLTNSFKKQWVKALNTTRQNSSTSSNTAASNEEPPTISLDQKLQALLSKDLVVPVFKKALLYDNKIALKDQHGEFSYAQLFSGSKKLSIQISNLCGSASLSRVAYLCPNDQNSLITKWACWMSGQVAVPLSANHPAELLEYFLLDSQASLFITTPEFEAKLKPLAERLSKPLIVIEHENFVVKEVAKDSSILDKKLEHVLEIDNKLIIDGVQTGEFYKKSPAMILYTSGTTNKPKGVVMTYSNLDAQIKSLTNAWNITATDTTLHSLPLNHVHGIINAMLVPLSAGSKIVMLPKFDSDSVWTFLLNVNMPIKDRISCFMGVPTMYQMLVQEYDKLFSKNSQMSEYIKSHCQTKIRLMISGSAPLPAPLFQRWKEITGHTLLERYGMTEIGMALSNPLLSDKVRQRLPGYVGVPLPDVQVRITDPDDTKKVLFESKGEQDTGFWAKQEDLPVYSAKADSPMIAGNLQVKGPSVFHSYWNKPEETKKEFQDGTWFKTGDTAAFDPVKNSFKILGRSSVDIIKTGGYKISALEVETKLLESPQVSDCAVLGVPDKIWGQKIVSLVQLTKACEEDAEKLQATEQLKKWCEAKMASYSIPVIFKFVPAIPRNQMGKVNKKELLLNHFNEVPE